ncbi:MAG: hypothetical protein Q4E59_01985 [Bacteroidales bacterium]|nr:hypothetical protein [Bacteroidales bacterium]
MILPQKLRTKFQKLRTKYSKAQDKFLKLRTKFAKGLFQAPLLTHVVRPKRRGAAAKIRALQKSIRFLTKGLGLLITFAGKTHQPKVLYGPKPCDFSTTFAAPIF